MVRSEPLQSVRAPEHLWIAGENPVSRAVVRLAEAVNFRVSFFSSGSSDILGQALFTSGVPVVRSGVIVLDSLEEQIAVLTHWAKLPFMFLGVAGTREQKAQIIARLSGIVARDQLDRIQCPAGLNIGAVTPDEAAVGIVARLIQNRSDRRISHEAAGCIRSPSLIKARAA